MKGFKVTVFYFTEKDANKEHEIERKYRQINVR